MIPKKLEFFPSNLYFTIAFFFLLESRRLGVGVWTHFCLITRITEGTIDIVTFRFDPPGIFQMLKFESFDCYSAAFKMEKSSTSDSDDCLINRSQYLYL